MESASPADVACALQTVCSGCSWLGQSYQSQLKRKLRDFESVWREADLGDFLDEPRLISVAPGAVRDRVDLMYERQGDATVLGFLSQDRNSVVEVESCPMMSPELSLGFRKLRERRPTVTKRGSVRLRVSSSGMLGVWLDFSNWDVKGLLDEVEWLTWLLDWSFVEIGQRHKVLFRNNSGELKLRDPILHPWFETYDGTGNPIALYGTVASFSQPGRRVNRELVRRVQELARPHSGLRWLELFCGNGNFTFALASLVKQIRGFELNSLAVTGAQRTIEDLKNRGWDTSHLAIDVGDVQSAHLKIGEAVENCDVLLVDPPRSGMGRSLSALSEVAESRRPSVVVYVSCHLDSLVRDAQFLTRLGYRARRAQGVDQFPQTPHCEWVLEFVR